jgi:hypothetical protein
LNTFNEFVIEHYQRTTWNFSQPIQTIAKRAGLGKISRSFDNMRMTRSNEVERRFGSKKESLWIGHSERVMIKHYLVLEDEDYLEAAGESTARPNAEETRVDSQDDHAKFHAISPDSDGLG